MKIVASHEPNGPLGAKEASESSLGSIPPALAAAVAEAIGVRLPGLPLSPDRVLAALQARRREERLKSALGGR